MSLLKLFNSSSIIYLHYFIKVKITYTPIITNKTSIEIVVEFAIEVESISLLMSLQYICSNHHVFYTHSCENCSNNSIIYEVDCK